MTSFVFEIRGQSADTIINNIEKDYQRGDFGQAIQKIKTQLKSDTTTKNLIYYYNRLGGMYYNIGEMDSALYFADNAVRLDKNSGQGNLTRALILSWKQKYKEALNDINTAIKYRPECAICYHMRAYLYRHLKNKKLAKLDLEKTKELALKINDQGLYKAADDELKNFENW